MARSGNKSEGGQDVKSADQHLRLELLRLVYRHDRSAEDIIARAQTLELFVMGVTQPLE